MSKEAESSLKTDLPALVPAEAQVPGAVRTTSGGIETSDGTFYVSKPFRSGTSKKLRAMISFVPRTSHFDTSNVSSGTNEFRGFFTLFWISVFLLVVQNYVRSFETHGYPIELAFAAMFSRDATMLAISDGVLVFSTVLSVPFAKAVARGSIRYYHTGLVIQHLFQALMLATAITWTFNRQWPWVQSGFLTLHTLVMIMKMHSYTSVNGYLQYVNAQYESTLRTLRAAASAVGGWDKAVADARAHKASFTHASTATTTPDLTPEKMPGALTRSYINADMASELRNRLLAVPATGMNGAGMNGAGAKYQLSPPPSEGPEPHVLVDHPDERISSLAEELSDMDVELTSTGPKKIRWPANISLKNYADYLLIPTLVYDLEYPRTDRIRPLYLFEKTTATFGTFALLYTVTENFILPLVPTKEQSFWKSLLDLALPFMMAYLLLFYIIFECICNGFAELSCFADRLFYEDWVWNSTSWDEFARKWNKPVHTFLLRHVYASTMSSYKLSRTSAMLLTFVVSAALHELVMAIVTKKIRMYLFILQLIQVPMIALGRLPIIKRNKLLGNVVFWLGLYAGFPLLCVAYCAY